jgi:DNA modification methylase
MYGERTPLPFSGLLNKHILDDYKNVKVDAVDLFVIDPPYGQIVSESYDKVSVDRCVEILYELLEWAAKGAKQGSTMYLFGAVGKKKIRPFFKFLSEFEQSSKWQMQNFITWKKRRGYGTQYNYLFTREEIAFLIYDSDKPAYFSVPYLAEERSAAWHRRLRNCVYKPKKNNYRRSNVFTDINELFRNQHKGLRHFCVAEKPTKLYDVLIETSCPLGGLVVDPMSGSGTTAVVCNSLGREEQIFSVAKRRLLS